MGVGIYLANFESKGLPRGRSPDPWIKEFGRKNFGLKKKLLNISE
jgi:hypothetical protein